jgi:hypothetical protein
MKKQRFINRWMGMVILAAAAVGLCMLSGNRNPWLSLNACLAEPSACDGKWVSHFREPVIGALLPDGFLLMQKRGPSIRVRCDTTGLVEGEYVGIKAVFHKEGYLDHAVFLVAHGRREKIVISAFPALGICIWFLFAFKWNGRKRGLEPRTHA